MIRRNYAKHLTVQNKDTGKNNGHDVNPVYQQIYIR